MDQVPLVAEAVDAGRRFLLEFDRVFPVDVAFWMKDRDESTWQLHFASASIGDQDRQRAFSEIVRILREMNTPWLGPLGIKLRKADERVVQFARDIRQRYPASLTSIFNVPAFDGVDTEGMYVYPPLKSIAA